MLEVNSIRIRLLLFTLYLLVWSSLVRETYQLELAVSQQDTNGNLNGRCSGLGAVWVVAHGYRSDRLIVLVDRSWCSHTMLFTSALDSCVALAWSFSHRQREGASHVHPRLYQYTVQADCCHKCLFTSGTAMSSIQVVSRRDFVFLIVTQPEPEM